MNTLLIASAVFSMAHAAVYSGIGSYRDDKCATVPSIYQVYNQPQTDDAQCTSVAASQMCINAGGSITGSDPFNMFVAPACHVTQSTPQSIVESKFQGKEYFQQQIYTDDKCENLGIVQGNLANECIEMGPYMSGKLTVNTDGSLQLEYYYQTKDCKGNKFTETLSSNLLKGQCQNLADIVPTSNSGAFSMFLQNSPNTKASVKLSIVKPAQAKTSGASSIFNMSLMGSIMLLAASL